MKQTPQKGFSLVELMMAMAMSSILMLAAGVLLLGSNHAFRQAYASIHDTVQEDAKVLTSAFGAIARKSNRTNYKIYTVQQGVFVEAVPEQNDSTAVGQAVEFRYWDAPFYETIKNMDEMDITDTGTHYALFYLSGDKLNVDYGNVVNGVGAIQNGTRQTANCVTQRLVEKVDISNHTDFFSHEIVGGAGNGCVVLNLTVTNDEGDTKEIKMASLIRVAWPQ